MANKIKSEGNQAFNVPNTPEGLLFIKQLRQFSNQKKKNEFRARGRGRRDSYAQKVGRYTARTGLSAEFATWFAVYMDNASNERQKLVSRLCSEKYDLQTKNSQLSDEIARLIKLTGQAKSDSFLENEITRLKAEREVRTQQSSRTIQSLEAEVVRLTSDVRHYRDESAKFFSENQEFRKKSNEAKVPVQAQGITITVPKGTNINVVEG